MLEFCDGVVASVCCLHAGAHFEVGFGEEPKGRRISGGVWLVWLSTWGLMFGVWNSEAGSNLYPYNKGGGSHALSCIRSTI